VRWRKTRPRKRSPIQVYKGPAAEIDAEQFAAMAARLAPILGFCNYCGATVDEASGRLHAPDCAVPADRKVAS
jgi:hypothetical protein